MAFLESIKVGATTYRFPFYHGSAPSSSALSAVQLGSTSYSWLSGSHLLKNKNSLSRVITDINYKGTLYNLPGIEYLWTSTANPGNVLKIGVTPTGSSKYQNTSYYTSYSSFSGRSNSRYMLNFINSVNSPYYNYCFNFRVECNLVFKVDVQINIQSTVGFTYSNEKVGEYSSVFGKFELYFTGNTNVYTTSTPGGGTAYLHSYNGTYNIYYTTNYSRISTLQPSSSIPDSGHYGRFLIGGGTCPTIGNPFNNTNYDVISFNAAKWINGTGILFNR